MHRSLWVEQGRDNRTLFPLLPSSDWECWLASLPVWARVQGCGSPLHPCVLEALRLAASPGDLGYLFAFLLGEETPFLPLFRKSKIQSSKTLLFPCARYFTLSFPFSKDTRDCIYKAAMARPFIKIEPWPTICNSLPGKRTPFLQQINQEASLL